MFLIGTVVNVTWFGGTVRSSSARLVTFRFWSTRIADSVACRKSDSRTGLVSVPELIASCSSEDSSCCWSLIRWKSDSANECRSRANISAWMPFT